MPTGILTYVVDELYRFELSILPLRGGYVGFELYRVERGVPMLAAQSWCDEGALSTVRRCLRENIRAYQRKISQEDLLTPFFKKEHAFIAKYNGRYESPRRSSRRQKDR